MTSWAILALIYAEFPDKSVVERATRVIMDRQRKDGRWEQEGPEGIFNQSCAIYNPCELTNTRPRSR
jgi:lanosterol synthase